jgi:hypothetical protein
VVEVIGGIDEEEDFAYSASLGTGGWTPKSST